MPTTHAHERGMTRVWVPRSPIEVGVAPPASNLEPLVARILEARGLTGGAEDFLNPSLKQLHEPALMPGIDRAAERLLAGLRRGEPIAIYGDYDVDGVSATAILYHAMRAVEPRADVRTYVPHRVDEGYGLHDAALRQLAAEGVKLVVSVDCGVTAVGPARAAADAGLDLIITDHHNLPEGSEAGSTGDLPAAYAIVHPRLPGSAYPFGDLCGAGVAFKLAWRLASQANGGGRVREDLKTLLIELLAFAALGAVADAVPLLGENRVIARFGLSRIKHSRIIGLRAIVEASGLAGNKVDSEHVGFVLGPRLNACGRMGHARDAVELFTTAGPERAADIARTLSGLNDERRATEIKIVEQAVEMAHAAGMTGPDRRAVVLAHPEWHTGVLGIACSRLVDRFHRPTILMQTHAGECRGSGRSIDGYSLHAGLARCAGLLTTFGGHDMAAGLHLPARDLEAFVEAFVRDAGERLAPEDLAGRVTVDCDARLEEMTAAAVARLEMMAPFGQGNPRPRVLVRGVRLAAAPQPLGKEGKHLALQLRQGATLLRSVAWNWGPSAARLARGVDVDVVVAPKLSSWNGSVRVEPELVDLRVT